MPRDPIQELVESLHCYSAAEFEGLAPKLLAADVETVRAAFKKMAASADNESAALDAVVISGLGGYSLET